MILRVTSRGSACAIALLAAVFSLAAPRPVRADDAPPDSVASAAAPAPLASVAVGPAPQSPAPAAPPRAPAPIEPPPATLDHVEAWVDYKTHHAITALPLEARIFYRRGLMAHEAGARDAAFALVRGAAQLDPSFAAPHLVLARWLFAADPGQSLGELARLYEIARQSFPFQLGLGANLVYAVLQAILLGLLAVGMLLALAHHQQLHHRWQESIARFVPRQRAGWWAWLLLFLPFMLGLGPALPLLFLLASLWPAFKRSERAVFVALATVVIALPLSLVQLDRLGSPLREDQPPLYGVMGLEYATADSALDATLEQRARNHADAGFVQFARGWVARRRENLPAAEAAYRRALELWPDDDRVLNNLGNVLSLEKRDDEALELYQRAVRRNPSNAAAHYNLARIYTSRFQFRQASDAMARASALNFDPLKPYLTQNPTREALPPADLWITPGRFWDALAAYRSPAHAPLALPPSWRTRIEFIGWPYSVAAFLCVLAGLVLGFYQHRRLPLRHCGNCGRVVCRRCAERRREVALCQGCARVEHRSEAWEYGTMLLSQHRRQVRARRRAFTIGLAMLLPGYGWVHYRRLFPAWLLLTILAALATSVLDIATPFSFEAGITRPTAGAPFGWVIGAAIAIELVSMLGYALEARREHTRLELQSRTPLRRTRPQSAPARVA